MLGVSRAVTDSLDIAPDDTSPGESGPARSWVWRVATTLLAVAIAAALVGSAVLIYAFNFHGVQRKALATGPVSGTTLVTHVSTLSEQQTPCGVRSAAPFVRFNAKLRIDRITICAVGRGPNYWPPATETRNAQTAAHLDDLSAALAQPDKKYGLLMSCTVVEQLVTPFIVIVDGQPLAPALPIDQCGSGLPAALKALSTTQTSTSDDHGIKRGLPTADLLGIDPTKTGMVITWAASCSAVGASAPLVAGLTKPLYIDAVDVCWAGQDGTHHALRLERTASTAALFGRVSQALVAPSAPSGSEQICPAYAQYFGYSPVLGIGEYRIRPRWPVDGCGHVLPAGVQALTDLERLVTDQTH